jgi:ammonium transporter Rh
MILIGFGFIMAFMKQYSWSAISYTFLINGVMIQLYILLSYFWKHVFIGNW